MEEEGFVEVQDVKCFTAAFSKELRTETMGNLGGVWFSAKKGAKFCNICQAWPSAVPKPSQCIMTFPIACPSMDW